MCPTTLFQWMPGSAFCQLSHGNWPGTTNGTLCGTSRLEPLGHLNMKTAPPRNIDEYIAGFPRDVQEILQEIRDIIKKAAPDAEEAIKYQIPTFVLHGNLVHFAAFQRHIGFYPTPSAIQEFKDELSSYESAKGSVQFPLDMSVPFSLVRKIVKFRVMETRAKMAARKKKK
jgi:uncharacterized protein YdhG (YjbR/CyaY superfamily)